MNKANLLDILTAVDRHKIFVLLVQDNVAASSIRWLSEHDVQQVNIGVSLSSYLRELKNHEYLHIEAYEFVRNLLDKEKRRISEGKNEVVSVYNFGILLEPFLQINAVQLFKDFSKTSALLLLWEHGVSANGVLSWPSQQEEFHFDFSDLQLKYIEDAL